MLVGALWLVGALSALQRVVYDSALAQTTVVAPADVVLVDIDVRSLAAVRGGWTDETHAALIDRLALGGAKTIVYTAPLAATAAPGAQEALARSVALAGNVLWPAGFASTGAPAPLPPSFYRSVVPELAGLGPDAVPVQLAALAAGAAGVGHLQWAADSDGVLRRVPLLLSHDKAGVPSLAMLAVLRALYLSPADVRWNSQAHSLLWGGLSVGVDASAALRPVFGASVPRWVAADVLAQKVPVSALRDKTVVVGVTAGPQAASWSAPGGATLFVSDVVAQSFVGLRSARAVTKPDWGHPVGWAAALVMALLVVVMPRAGRAVVWGAGAAVLLCVAQWLLLQQALYVVPLLPAAGVALLGGLLRAMLAWVPQRASAASPQESADAERMMGLALHGRGDLLEAFARFRPLPTSDALKDNLYHLGKDFERKKDYAHAKKVFKHLLRRDMEYKDARACYRRAKAHLLAQAGMAADSVASSGISVTGASSLPASVQETFPRHKVPGPLAHYDLKHELGKGAMGVVYQGRDLRSGQIVAIKTLSLQQEFDGAALVDARERFFKEAEAASRLQHPHIVTIYGSGEEQGLAYIAMEFVAGTDLSAFTQPAYLLPVAQVVSIAHRVAQSLDYAHAHNVVHRDVKPANIMWDAATDTVKVMDFGVARITDASKTRTGIVLGTPSFMSPEQLSGAKVDGRADLYALGVTLFQLLTGSLPLRADSMPELMRKIVHVDPPDIRTLRTDLPEAVARLVAKALRKLPTERYQTGQQLAQDLAYVMGIVASAVPGSPASAVVYDSGRTPTGQHMVDLEKTVLEYPTERAPEQGSVVASVG